MITAAIIGDRELVARLARAPAAVNATIVQAVAKLGYRLEAEVKLRYLTGPRPTRLGVKTGRLRSSIGHGAGETRSRQETGPTASTYYVGTNVPYGLLWELGFDRKTGAGARGGPRTLSGKARDRYFARHPPGSKHMGARPFLAPALEALRPLIVSELTAALQAGVRAALKP